MQFFELRPLVLAVIAATAINVCASPPAFAQASLYEWELSPLNSLGTPQLRRKLAPSMNILWQGLPLRDGVKTLCDANQIPFVIDRRLDPSRQITLTLPRSTIENLIQRIGDAAEVSPLYLENVLYFAPSEHADAIATQHWELFEQVAGKMPANQKSRAVDYQSLAWKELSKPRDILRQIERAWKIKLNGIDDVPHDLWGATNLPSSSLACQLSVVLSGFGLAAKKTSAVENGKPVFEIIPIPETHPITVRFRSGAPSAAMISKAERDFGPVQAVRKGTATEVTAPAVAFQGWLRPLPPVSRPDPKLIRLSFDVENVPVPNLLDQLARSQGLMPKWLVNVDAYNENRLTLSIKEASLDEIWSQVGKAAGLKISPTASELIITAQ